MTELTPEYLDKTIINATEGFLEHTLRGLCTNAQEHYWEVNRLNNYLRDRTTMAPDEALAPIYELFTLKYDLTCAHYDRKKSAHKVFAFTQTGIALTATTMGVFGHFPADLTTVTAGLIGIGGALCYRTYRQLTHILDNAPALPELTTSLAEQLIERNKDIILERLDAYYSAKL